MRANTIRVWVFAGAAPVGAILLTLSAILSITGAAGQPRPVPTERVLVPVTQRATLYEEDPADPEGKSYLGSAVWRTETMAETGAMPELAVRCDIDFPDRQLAMTLVMRRNTDPALPASHTVEIVFQLPADPAYGGISRLAGILMKQYERSRGISLTALVVDATAGSFLVGLSSIDAEKERNLLLLKERAWFDIAVVYGTGRRALIAMEKGGSGERAFKDAFAGWEQ